MFIAFADICEYIHQNGGFNIIIFFSSYSGHQNQSGEQVLATKINGSPLANANPQTVFGLLKTSWKLARLSRCVKASPRWEIPRHGFRSLVGEDRGSGLHGGVGHGEEWATGRSGPLGGVGHREEWATRRSGSQGGAGHKEEWTTGRSGSHGGVGHKKEWATGRWEPHVGMGHREEWVTWRSGPQGGVGHKDE